MIPTTILIPRTILILSAESTILSIRSERRPQHN